MMKNKNTILIIFAIGLGLTAIGIFKSYSLNEKTKFPGISFSSKISSITIANAGETYTLEKKEDSWLVKDNDDYFPADKDSVSSITKTLKELKIVDIVSKNPNRYKDFDVDADSAVVVDWYKGEKKAGTLMIGKSDFARGGDYVRIGENKGVYITDGSIRSVFTKENYKDLKVISVDRSKINKIQMEYKNKKDSFVLVKEKDGDNIKWGMEGEDVELDDKALEKFLSDISSINAKEIIKFDETRDFGFKDPYLKITLKSDDGDYILTFGNQASEMPAYYVLNNDKKDWVYFVPVSFVYDNIKKKGDLEK